MPEELVNMPDIHHELLIEAPKELIFDALTTQQGLAGWWAPKATAKPERGSVARIPFGPGYFKRMRVDELVLGERVRWTCLEGADEWVDTKLSFEIKGGGAEALSRAHPEIDGQVEQLNHAGKATLMIFRHDGWRADTPMFAECNYTWGQFLRSLKLYCETGKGRPHPTQHRVES
jgi:uncharacterized protein YndB with AHSA1/START domain